MATNAPQQPGRLVIDFGRLGSRLGLVVSAVGLLVIGLGYLGAASNDLLVEQFPYLISGGVLGLALIIVGNAFTIAQNAREDANRIEAKLDELLDAMSTSSSPLVPGQLPGQRASAPLPPDVSGLVAAGAASYHSPTCRLVDGREQTTYLTAAEARARGLKACRVCSPDGAIESADVQVH